MHARIIIIGGRATQREVALELPAVLGRSSQVSVTISHSMISRKHCMLFEQAGVVLVRDLGSLNGTFIKGKRIVEAPLRPGDSFSIGPLKFRVVYQPAAPIAELPPTVFAPMSETKSEEELGMMQSDAWSSQPSVLDSRALQVAITSHQPLATAETAEELLIDDTPSEQAI
ncbi:MAG: FHA domain-containing protein [Planctomycetota bacterium]